jgi:hypothetical protein
MSKPTLRAPNFDLSLWQWYRWPIRNNFPNFTTCSHSTRSSQRTYPYGLGTSMKDSEKVLLAVIVGLAILLPFASAYTDGLETVAQNAGIKQPREPLAWTNA